MKRGKNRRGIFMNQELIGMGISLFDCASIIGILGGVQFKGNIPLNINQASDKYDAQLLSKIIGVHVMIFAVILFCLPFIFYSLRDTLQFDWMEEAITILIALLMIININIQANKKS